MKATVFLFLLIVTVSSAFGQIDTLIFEWNFYIPVGGDFYPLAASRIYAENIFGDDNKEIVACDHDRIIIYDGNNGTRIWTGPFAADNRDLFFRDLNDDGHPEIAELDNDGVSIFDAAGNHQVWRDRSREFGVGCFTLGDINGDGFQDVVIVRREVLSDDFIQDTAWIDIYYGPDFNLAGQSFFLMMGYHQNRSLWYEYPTSVEIAVVSGEQEMSRRIFVFSSIDFDSIYIDNPYLWSRKGHSGVVRIIDPDNLQQNRTFSVGRVTSHKIKRHNGNTYLYALSDIYDQTFVRPDSDLSSVFGKESIFCLSADTIIDNPTLWVVDTSYEWWVDWHWEKIEDFDDNNPGDELCFTLLDTISLVSFPELEPLWRRGATRNIVAPLFSYHPKSLYDSPQILSGDPHSQMPSVMFRSSDGIQSAVFVRQSIDPTIVADMNQDRNDEVLCLYLPGLIFVSLAYHYSPELVDDSENPPADFLLSQNYPNPFNAQTTISYSLAEPGPVTLTIYNLLGQKVATLFDGVQTAGEHKVVWDATGKTSGIYFSRLYSGNANRIVAMSFIK